MMLELTAWLGGIALVLIVVGTIWDGARSGLGRRRDARHLVPRPLPMAGYLEAASFLASPGSAPIGVPLIAARFVVDASCEMAAVPGWRPVACF